MNSHSQHPLRDTAPVPCRRAGAAAAERSAPTG